MLKREFTREKINDMGEEPFMDLHRMSMTQVIWDQHKDTLVFYFTENSWIYLILKHPELQDWYFRDA